MNGQDSFLLIFNKYDDFFLTWTGQYERKG